MASPKPKQPGDGDGISCWPPPPPTETDPYIVSLRTRLANSGREAEARAARERLPRRLLPLAWCFAVGVWIAVVAMCFAPQTEQLVRWSRQTISDLRAPAQTAVPPDGETLAWNDAEPALVPPVPENCGEARALGLAPAHEGHPGYAPWLDGDGDGISCEAARWRSRPQ